MSIERFGTAEDLYAPSALDHFTSPRNVGGVEAPDGKGSDTNPACGDRTTITVRVSDGRVAATALAVAKLCDGVVVGSRIVQEIENSTEQNVVANVSKLVKELRQAVDQA